MSINDLCDFLLTNIMEFIPDNKNSYYFAVSSKYFYELFKKRGFLKSYNISSVNNLGRDMLKYHPHHASLVYISVSHISNPNVWMFGGYPKNVIFNYCNFNSLIDPPLSRTQRMIINGVGRCTKKEIKINLKKFPKLKELRVTSGLRVHDIDGTLLEVERKNLNDCYLKIKC